mgnify:CR=1 FL=1
MAKQSKDDILNTKEQPVSKGLSYSKKDYEDIVTTTKELIDECKKNGESADTIKDLYGMYYGSIAGLLRAGALCRRQTSIDGFPEIVTLAHAKEYICREDALYSILGSETKDIIHPYEDTFLSYVRPAFSLTSSLDHEASETLKHQLDESQKQYQESEDKLKLNSETVTALQNEITLHKNKNKELSEQLVSAKKEMEKYKNLYIAADGAAEKQLESYQKKENDYKKQLLTLQTKAERIHDEYQTLQSNVAEEKENRRHFTYNPNYDQYYSDMLPKILDSLEYSHSDTLIKTACTILCSVGILLSLLFLV